MFFTKETPKEIIESVEREVEAPKPVEEKVVETPKKPRATKAKTEVKKPRAPRKKKAE